MARPTCATCAAYQRLNEKKPLFAECRRRPPEGMVQNNGESFRQWPVVHHLDWCLEHVAKADAYRTPSAPKPTQGPKPATQAAPEPSPEPDPQGL